MGVFEFDETNVMPEELRLIKQDFALSYIGSMRLKKGMKLFAIELETLNTEPAVFRKNLQTNRLELHKQKGFVYVPAINAQNAIKKLLKHIGK